MTDEKKGDRKATVLIGTPAVMPRADSEPPDSDPGPPDSDPEPSSRKALTPDEPTDPGDAALSAPQAEASDPPPSDPPPSDRESEPETEPESDRAPSDPVDSDPPPSEDARPSAPSDPPVRVSVVERPSLLMELRKSRTTIIELSSIADRLSRIQPDPARPAEPNIVKQMLLSFLISLTVVLLVAMIFVGGTWRIVLGIMGGTCGMTLAVFAGFRALPRVAKWIGPRELPGRAWMWLGGVAVVLASAAGALVWTLSEATASLAMIGVPDVKAPEAPASAEVTSAPEEAPADAALPRDARVSLEDGVVYVPPGFSAPDGHFDLIVHFHGNTDLVAQSVAASKINAIVYIINYGESSSVYARPFSNPDAFDRLLVGVERRVARMGLERPRVERVALASWSAGYGALYHILRSRSRLDRVDALLLMDSLHASFAPGSETAVDDASLAPFVSFAKRAIAGEKLMVLTHTRIATHGYASTEQSADGLLARLELAREDMNPEEASPPRVDIPVALAAFPAREQKWMQVITAVHENNFHLLGCKGNDKPDHIAHLAQMSVTVLPPLAERWSAEKNP